MGNITKQDALAIVKKCRAKVDTKGSAHDYAEIFFKGKKIARVGIRRGSKKDTPHNHLADDLGLSRNRAKDFAACRISFEDWAEGRL